MYLFGSSGMFGCLPYIMWKSSDVSWAHPHTSITQYSLGYHVVWRAPLGKPFPAYLGTRPFPSGILIAFIVFPIQMELGGVSNKAQKPPSQRLLLVAISIAFFLLESNPRDKQGWMFLMTKWLFRDLGHISAFLVCSVKVRQDDSPSWSKCQIKTKPPSGRGFSTNHFDRAVIAMAFIMCSAPC